LRSVLRPLEESLHLSHEQCAHLLQRYGMSGAAAPPRAPVDVVRQLVAQPLGELVEELERTVAYVAQQFPKLKPARLWLLGGGAAIRGLPAHLGERVRLPTQAWRLPAASENAEAEAEDAAFGAAAALSALKWEAQPCT
jgi:Tfp pilus assembly PilM family ATPase